MFNLKKLISVSAFLVAGVSLLGVQVGDTYEQVISSKGPPQSQMEAGAMQMLFYPGQTIKLKEGRVIALATPPPEPLPAAASPSPNIPAPKQLRPIEELFPKNFVGTPEFDTTAGRQSAGTACLARREHDGRLYLLTVRHLLGPDGGFRRLVSPDEVPSFVKGISLHGLFGGTQVYDASGLQIPTVADTRDPLYDLAIFQTSNAQAGDAALLANASPSPGETVWLIAHVRGGVPPGTFIHRATVVQAGEWLVCELTNQQIITNGASGGPVLNSEGRIVGLYAGHVVENGTKYAYIIPSTLIEKILSGL